MKQFMLLTILVMGLVTAACGDDGGESPANDGATDTTDSDTTDNDTADSDTADGDTADGDTADGDTLMDTGGADLCATVDCSAQATACATAACNPADGTCVVTPADDGTSCDDGSACTSGDACLAGACTGAAATCDDGNACTADTCDPVAGCQHPPAPSGGACDDADACTEGDVCDGSGGCAGTAVMCNDDNPCTVDSCGASGCEFAAQNDGTACDDGDSCTTDDACAAGTCGGSPLACDDGNPCTADSCQDGTCVYAPVVAGSPCDTGVPCTTGTCDGGGTCDAQQTFSMAWPVGGARGSDWALYNTFDNALEITFPSFRQSDDNSALVGAAEAGVVTAVETGFYDRELSFQLDPDTTNHVTVTHADGSFIQYRHLKRGSAQVAVGDSVTVGQVLGVGAASGDADRASVRLFVHNCEAERINPIALGLLEDEPNPFGLLEAVVIDGEVTTNDEVYDPPPNITATYPGATISVAAYVAGPSPGANTVEIELVDPSNGSTTLVARDYSSSSTMNNIDVVRETATVGTEHGDWQVVFRLNGSVAHTQVVKVGTPDQLVRTRVPYADLTRTFDWILAARPNGNYRVRFADGYDLGGAGFANIVLERNSAGYGLYWRQNVNTLIDDIDASLGSGLVPSQLDVFLHKDEPRHLVVLKPGSADTDYFFNVPSASGQAAFDAQISAGRRPVLMGRTLVAGELVEHGLFTDASAGAWSSQSSVGDSNDLLAETQTQVTSGKHLAWVNAYPTNAGTRYSVVFTTQAFDQGTGGSVGADWQATIGYLQSEWDAGRVIDVVTGFEQGGTHAFTVLTRAE